MRLSRGRLQCNDGALSPTNYIRNSINLEMSVQVQFHPGETHIIPSVCLFNHAARPDPVGNYSFMSERSSRGLCNGVQIKHVLWVIVAELH
jgi:hypothetical protein